MTQTTDSGPPTTGLRPPPSDLRTGTQFPVSSIQYQVPYTDNAANRLATHTLTTMALR